MHECDDGRCKSGSMVVAKVGDSRCKKGLWSLQDRDDGVCKSGVMVYAGWG